MKISAGKVLCTFIVGFCAPLAAFAQVTLAADPPIACPEGTSAVGGAPPKDFRQYCTIKSANGNMLRSGPEILWFKNGLPKRKGQYYNGLLDGKLTEWYENGRIARESLYQAGKQEGPTVYWHGNGLKAAEGNFANGLQQGHWLFYDTSGAKITEQEFRDGVVVVPSALPSSASHLEVSVDPRIELLSAVLSLTDWPSSGPWSNYGSEYERDFQKAFGSYKKHPAVAQLDKLLSEGFAFDAPVGWILHYCPPPELTQCTPLDETSLKRGGGQSKLDALAEALRSFAKETKFMEFYERHKLFYNELAVSYKEQAPGDDALGLIEKFYGERKAAYSMIIAPWFGGGNYGVRTQSKEGERVYNVGAPHGYVNGHYTFDRNQIYSMVFHEFGHSFTNPVVDAYPGVDAHSKWFKYVQETMSEQAYGNWHTVMYELMVRTNEIHLMQAYDQTTSAEILLANYTSTRGFVWLPYTLERLHEYESNRSQYPTYKSFIGHLFAVLDEHKPFIVEGKLVFLLPKSK